MGGMAKSSRTTTPEPEKGEPFLDVMDKVMRYFLQKVD
jgi:hypothetical protein